MLELYTCAQHVYMSDVSVTGRGAVILTVKITMEEQETPPSENDQVRKVISLPIPKDVGTDYNLERWWKGWQGDLERIKMHFESYIINRRAAGLEDPALIDNFLQHPVIRRVLPVVRMSVKPFVVNTKDNTIVVINCLGNIEHLKLARVLTSGELLMYYFVTAEYFFKQVLEQERRTGKMSGVTLIYDLFGLKVLDYLNPFSAIMQIFALGSTVIQEYYCELLTNLFIINPGPFVKFAFTLVKSLLVPRTLQKVRVLSGDSWKSKLCEYVSADALPVQFGGTWTEIQEGIDPLTCCTVNTPIQESLYFQPKQVQAGSTLFWQFFCTGKFTFTIIYKNNDGDDQPELMLPRLVMITPLGSEMPEEGTLLCKRTGIYTMEFASVGNSYFSTRLDYAYQMICHMVIIEMNTDNLICNA
ncbi:CRAL-TRIO domain-containing protein C34C12.6 [Trichinella murrelli]|uniref:CRAL-TRIO domain-containing protein C34C12.6 n=1 Tax=Trichinella murrelli TaxID=144512 RepID=A0A0V0TP19_9BILA|nr:CRAL-TRIO domain-containing protein C34C12.6 [Trichinella murrelli]